MSEQLGRCDKKQYEHCGDHARIGEYGQTLPPFPCENWKPVEAPAPAQPTPAETRRQDAIQALDEVCGELVDAEAHDRTVQAQALREAADDEFMQQHAHISARTWLRTKADALEGK